MGSQYNFGQDIAPPPIAHQSHPNQHFGATLHHTSTQPKSSKGFMQQLPQFVTPGLTQLPSSGEHAPALPTLSTPDPTFDLAFNAPHRPRRHWTGRTAQQAARADSGVAQQMREQMALLHSANDAMGRRIEALERK
jgi:hypothetical protein